MTVVVIGMLVTLLLACGSNEASLTVPAGAQAGGLVGLQSCTYEANKVEYGADCGKLTVPENRAAPISRLTALSIIRSDALGWHSLPIQGTAPSLLPLSLTLCWGWRTM